MKKILFALVLASSLLSQAALLSYEQGNLQIEGVNLNRTAAVTDANGVATNMKMDLLGAGLRSKTVLFVGVKVYVLQLFADNKPQFTRDANALASLNPAQFVAVKINMLRTVDAPTLAVSFREAIQANGFAIDAELTTLLNLIEKSADGLSGKSISLLLKSTAAGTNVYYEDTNGQLKSFSGTASIKSKILSIWLGKPADPGLAALKTSLLKPVY